MKPHIKTLIIVGVNLVLLVGCTLIGVGLRIFSIANFILMIVFFARKQKVYAIGFLLSLLLFIVASIGLAILFYDGY